MKQINLVPVYQQDRINLTGFVAEKIMYLLYPEERFTLTSFKFIPCDKTILQIKQTDMKIIQLIFFFLMAINNLFGQNTDQASFHNTRQLSDSSFSLKKPSGDSTVFIFTGNGGSQNSGKQTFQQVTDKDSVSSHKISVKNLNLSGILEYPDDSTAVVAGKLNLNDVYKTGNLLKIVTSLPSLPLDTSETPSFTFTINNRTGAALPELRINNFSGGATHFDIKINWGDGTIVNYTNGYDYTVTHHYTSNNRFNIKVFVSDNDAVDELWSGMDLYNSYIDSIGDLNLLPNLYRFAATGSYFNKFNCKLPNNLQTLTIYIDNDSLDFNPTIALPSGLRELNLFSTQMRSFAPTLGLPATLNNLNLSNQDWTSNQVNAAFIYLNGLIFNSGTKNLEIRQSIGGGTPAPPTGAGVTAMNNLIANGWIITHD